MEQLVVFDVGGVLASIKFAGLFEELARETHFSVLELQQILGKSKAEVYAASGDLPSFYEQFNNSLGLSFSEERINQLYLDPIGEIPEGIAFKRRLHEEGYDVGILSNTTSFAKKHLDERWPEMFETYGGPQVLSYEVGSVKPDKRIYEPLINAAEKIIYIEDKSAYLQYPVEELGWIGIHLTPYQDFDEPIRSVPGNHGNIHIDSENFHIANSFTELEQLVETLLR